MGDSDQQISSLFEQAVAAFDGIVFGALALIGLYAWIRHRDRASGWFAGMCGSLAFVVMLGMVLPEDGGDSLLRRGAIGILALMPFCLYRFTRSFTPGYTQVDVLSSVLTLVVVGWALAVPIPDERVDWSAGTVAFIVVFLAHWALLSAISAWYFRREARRAQGVTGRRMRLFANAAIVLAVALLVSGTAGSDGESTGQLLLAAAIQLAGAVSGVLFWFALAPPRWLRQSWRSREFDAMQVGLRDMLAGETVVDVHERTLAAARRLTGGTGAIVLDDDGEPIAWEGMEFEEAEALAADVRHAREHDAASRNSFAVDRIVVATGPAAPFFGADEQRLLEMLCTFATMAERRAGTLAAERDANEKLRQLDQLKTEFVAMVAHDLRSPMSVITGFADTIHDRWDDLSDEDKLAYLRLISRNTRSLADFVEDVLQVARMESGELHYDMQPFDARAVVQRIVTDMQITHPEMTLTIDAPTELPAALGDEERNWQILTNLVSNAMKFSDGDPQIQVEIRSMPEEQAVAIAVRDNGVGISTEDQKRLFRRFSRVGQNHRAVAGTGLGLYIVKSMVEAQGGRIWVQSTPGEGSTFTYTLPVAQEGTAA